MATVYGVNATKREASPRQMIAAGEVNGRKRVAYDEYTFATLGNGDIVKLMKLPKGARVLNAELVNPAGGGSAAGKLGWEVSEDAVEAANDAGLIAATTMVSASALRSGVEPGRFKKFAAEVQVIMTATAAHATGGTLKVAVEYVID